MVSFVVYWFCKINDQRSLGEKNKKKRGIKYGKGWQKDC